MAKVYFNFAKTIVPAGFVLREIKLCQKERFGVKCVRGSWFRKLGKALYESEKEAA